MSMSMQTPGLSSGSRNIHTFVPLPRTSSSDSLMTHGGLPSHRVLNPEPHLRQIPHPRIMNPMREDVHPNPDDISTSSVRPISSSSTTGPFSRPDSSQVLWLLQDNMSAPVHQLILHPSPIPALPTIQNADASVQIHLKLLLHRLSLNRKLASEPSTAADTRLPASTPTDPASGRIAGAPEVEPSAPVSISIGTRVLNDIGDQQLLEYKQDSCSRPSWKTIGQRLRRTPESCQARWMFLQNTHRT